MITRDGECRLVAAEGIRVMLVRCRTHGPFQSKRAARHACEGGYDQLTSSQHGLLLYCGRRPPRARPRSALMTQ
ncbi:MAG: hypothetical protein MZV70_61130 [Desulfobacterales bacterium]|nr:hypothetical protein [Desulfobacterales bacterium]